MAGPTTTTKGQSALAVMQIDKLLLSHKILGNSRDLQKRRADTAVWEKSVADDKANNFGAENYSLKAALKLSEERVQHFAIHTKVQANTIEELRYRVKKLEGRLNYADRQP